MADADFSVKAIISAQTSQFEKGMKNAQSTLQKTSKSIEGVSKLLKSAFSIIGIGASINAIKSFGAECVKAADSANKSFKILDNTIKVTGATAWTSSEEMVKMSEEIAHSTNYTVGEIQDMQSVLLGFKNITEDTFESASIAITDMATVMGMDLKSAVQTVGKALDDPIKGLDSLRRQGFAFTDQQKEQMKVLVENGEIIKAQNMILEELNTTYGGAAQAAQSSFDKQKDAAIELKETLGNALLPIMDEVANNSTKTIEKVTRAIEKIDFARIAAEFEILFDVIGQILKGIKDNVETLIESLGIDFNNGENILIAFRNQFYSSLNDAWLIIQDTFGLIKAIINGDWATMWEYAKLIFYRVARDIVQELSLFQGEIKDKFNALLGYVKIASALHLVPSTVSTALQTTSALFETVAKNSEKTLNQLDAAIEETTKNIEKNTGKAADVALTNIDAVEKKKKKYVKNTKNLDKDIVTSANVTSENFKNKWLEAYQNISEYMSSNSEKLKEIVKGFAQEITDMFSQIGEDLFEGGLNWKDYAATAVEAIAQVLKQIAAELAALAVERALTYRWAEAAMALAGSAAAAVSAGVVSGMAKQLKGVSKSAKEAAKDVNTLSEVVTKFKQNLENIDKIELKGSTIMPNLHAWEDNLKNMSELAQEAKTKIEELSPQLEKAKFEYEMAKDAYDDHVNSFANALKVLFTGGLAGIELEKKRKKLKAILDKASSTYNELNDKVSTYKKELEELQKMIEETQEKINAAFDETLTSLRNEVSAVDSTISGYKELYAAAASYYDLINNPVEAPTMNHSLNPFDMIINYISDSLKYSEYKSNLEKVERMWEVVFLEQKNAIKKGMESLYSTLVEAGADLGEALIDSFIDGGTKTDFLASMKNYIRENLLKLAVYTESFQDRLAEIGTKLTAALLGGGNIKNIRDELESLWDEASESAKAAEAIISEVFGDIVDNAEDRLSELEKAIKSFKESVLDLGGELASNLVEGISNGLSQGEFLDDMKKWIRKMLVQSVVYTESMKAEIEAIGAAISKGLSEGFTETTFHEIRRDLSWVFDQANNTMENIDAILNSVFGGGYATGTNNATRGLHLVGEAGPELVRFRGGEQVLNANNTQKTLSGMAEKNITNNITFNNLQDTSAFVTLQQLKQYNRQLAINGVL